MPNENLASLSSSAAKSIKRYKSECASCTSSLIKEIKKAKAAIDSTYRTANEKNHTHTVLSQSERWIFDNYYLYDEKYSYIINGLKKQKQLPSCHVPDGFFKGKLLPLWFLSFCDYISETNFRIDRTSVSVFLTEAEKSSEAAPDYADYYSFSLLWMSGLFVHLAVFCQYSDDKKDTKETAEAIGKMTSALRFLSDFSFDSYLGNCAAEHLLRSDPSGDYCNMTDETKNYYRSQIATLAKKSGVTEEAFAKQILEKARAAEKRREKHIGFYLYPQKSKAEGILYFASIFMLTAVVMFFLVRMHIVSLILFVPVYELAKQISDKAFSYFTISTPLPRLKIDNLPDTDGVLTVITTVLTKNAVNELSTRLEDMFNSSGMKNTYFAVLADFPESDNLEETADSEVFSLLNDRISALNLKYGKSFFMFARSRSYCERERKFMGHERKRGAIVQLCKLLSGKERPGFINNVNLPDSSICDRIRFVLTLDSDTSIPPDAIRNLAGIMLHPLNRPEADKKTGVVTSGYGILQPAMSNELSAASKTLFSNIFGGNGGFEIYSFSGFEVYQNVFGEGTFCGKGIFDKNAFMSCIENESFAFPEHTVLSHDILEGARLRAANVTDLHFSDGFPKNQISYLKRHHRWVRGDTQNLIFLKKYIPTKSGRLIENNISLLSKYKLFDNFRRSAVPIFAYRAIIAACFLPKNISAVVLLFSVFYLIYGFISSFAACASSVGVGCTARKYFSRNAIPGILHSLYRCIIEISMLPSTALSSASAISVSLYRTFISKRKMLEWTTASSAENSVTDSLLYYIRKNLFCAVSGAAIYLFVSYSFLKLVGLMWFLFPIVSYYIGKERKEKKKQPSLAQKKTIQGYAADMWKFFCKAVTEKSSYLPVDNIQHYPHEIISHKTSPTNIGLYLASVLAARDFSFIDTNEMYLRLSQTVNTVYKLKKWNGHLYNWYSTNDCSVINPKIVSSVDSGNFIACVICLKEGLREYVNEKPELLDIILKLENIIDSTDISKLYDSEKKLFFIDVNPDDEEKTVYSANHFDMLLSEARTLSYIAVAKKAAHTSHYTKLSRPIIKHSDRIGVASWTGTAFEYFMPALFMPVIKGSLLYEALRFAMYRQKARFTVTKAGKLFGISESGYHGFDDDMNYQYKAFGIPGLAYKKGLDKELVISPYSSFLMMCLDIKAPLENLNRLKKEKAYGKFGFYEAYDFTESRCLPAQIVYSNMSHHVGMSILACANACHDNIFVKRFMRDAAMRSVHELLEEKIPIDCAIQKITSSKLIPERSVRG